MTERAERAERAVPELTTGLSPSHTPNHEVLIFLFNYLI